MKGDHGYLGGPIRSVLGNVDVSALLDFVDERRHSPEWQKNAEKLDRRDHQRLLRRLGVTDLRSSRPAVQRVQSDGTLAALHGAVL